MSTLAFFPMLRRPAVTVVQGLVLWLTASYPPLHAQTTEPTEGAERSSWFMYFGDHPVTKSWAIHLEGQARRQGVGQKWEELVIRPGVDHEFGHGLASMLAYTYVRRYPFALGSLGSANLSGPQPEHRIVEDVSYQHRITSGPHPATFTHRVRAEQRFLGSSAERVGTLYWKYGERARYRLTADFPLQENKGLRPNYVSIYNEVFARFGANQGSHVLDQNRMYGALGWNLSKTEQIEVGYLFQYMPVPNDTYGEQNNGLQFTLISTAPFPPGLHKKRKKADVPVQP